MKKVRNKFTVLAELNKTDDLLEQMRESSGYNPGVSVELQRKRTNLRHELKMIEAAETNPEATKKIQQAWKDRIKREKKEKEKLRGEVRKKIMKDPKELKEVLKLMTPEQRKALKDSL